MRRNSEQMIQKSIEEGYVFLLSGDGKYDLFYESKFEGYKADGYDVRSWSLKREDGTRYWVIYGKMKAPRSRKKIFSINYNALTVKELRKLCSEKKIRNYAKLSKAEIIERLNSAS